ncbi:MAG: tetratricopeptide repeat protein [Gemmataceae bacterium]|nr:tetratricopeptide repeat protein [Gemmataceae bacterium]
MIPASYRPLLALVVAAIASSAFAADDPIREKALKLNQTTGTSAMASRLSELLKDEAGTKKLLETAAKMVKDEKPNPLNYTACFILAKAAQIQKNPNAALVFYKACATDATKLGSAQKIIDVFNGMVGLYMVTKKYDEAIQACQEFLDIQIEDVENPINQEKPFMMEKLILATGRKGKLDDAIKLTENLIEKDKGGWYFVRVKAEVFRDNEKYSDAADAYLETIERLKKSKRLEDEARDAYIRRMRYTLSGVYVDMKDIDKGAEQLQILLKDDPENATFMNDLGFIWADNDLKIEESEKLIRKAIAKDREQRKKIEDLPKDEDVDNPAYLDSLGWVLFKKKEYKEAKQHLTTAIKLEGGKNIEIFDHLADVHMALGEKAEAIKVWKESLKIEDSTKRDTERRKKVEQKLAAAEKK